MDKKLLSYIKCVIDLEKSVYLQDKAIDRVRGEMRALGHKTEYNVPHKPPKKKVDLSFDDMWGFAVSSAVIGGIIGLFIGGFIKCALIGATGIPLLIYIIDCLIVASDNKELEQKYKQELLLYQRAVNKDNNRVKKENLEKERLQATINLMINKREQTKALRDKYYSINVIYPKYRSLVAMCSIYSYLESERCDGLKGPDGAYNKFDDDEHWERIYTKLDVVINKLDQIKDNQFMLYGAIQEGNRISKQIVDNSIQQIRLAEKSVENTALGAHYQQQAALEAKRTNELIMYDQWQRNRNS